MKNKLAIILMVSGFTVLAVQLYLQVDRERQLYKTTLTQQREAMTRGWKVEWQQLVLASLRSGDLDPGYTLNWDRSGTRLKSDFFPEHSSILDWSDYRKVREGKDRPAMKGLAAAFCKCAGCGER